MKQTNNQSGLDLTKAVAAASSTPFMTAFKVTMGVLFAQLFSFLIGLGIISLIVYAIIKAAA